MNWMIKRFGLLVGAYFEVEDWQVHPLVYPEHSLSLIRNYAEMGLEEVAGLGNCSARQRGQNANAHGRRAFLARANFVDAPLTHLHVSAPCAPALRKPCRVRRINREFKPHHVAAESSSALIAVIVALIVAA